MQCTEGSSRCWVGLRWCTTIQLETWKKTILVNDCAVCLTPPYLFLFFCRSIIYQSNLTVLTVTDKGNKEMHLSLKEGEACLHLDIILTSRISFDHDL